MSLWGSIVEILSTRVAQAGGSGTHKVEAVTEASSENAAAAQAWGHHGFISRPASGARGVRLRIGRTSIIVAAVRYNVKPPANPGETLVYSTDADGVVQGQHVLTDTGIHVFNKGTGHAARYEELKTAFDELKTDFNNLVDAYNLHVHTGVTTGSASSGTTPSSGTSSAADVSGAESNRVLIPTAAEE